MAKKKVQMGRPVVGKPKTMYINVRASEQTVKQMKKGAKKLGLSDGGYIAKLIEDAAKKA
jgi:predicted DNA binding CopG/RHH family protein